jgi:hypothetical protein
MNPHGLQRGFPKGMRVRLNQDGMASRRRLQNRSGKVVGYCRIGGWVQVLWDGNKTPQQWRCEHLMLDPR